ncbi:Hsp20/alpha crystallin family protein [Candidatus Micrarchaeota archaeon]|nr:Hsp20/alpha crystallin family protein [Candidatus Micrarchaeota archaeon]
MRKKTDFFNDGFFDEFERIQEEFEKMFEQHFSDFEPPRPIEGGKPLVYGFSMRVDEDGKPVISEFGNTARQERGAKAQGAREPLVDLINGEKEITIVAELPGVEKKNLQLKVSKNALNVDVIDPERRFAKIVRLPAEVDEKASKASLKNGILEVVLKKRVASKPQHSGESIKVD